MFILLLIIIAIYCTRTTAYFQDMTLLRQTIAEAGIWGYLLYILLFIFASLCFLPGSVFVIVGGLVFGPLYGTLLSLIAATMASGITFLMSRFLGRNYLVKRFGDNSLFHRIEQGIDHYGIDFLIFTRLVPIFPYNIQGYAYGLTAIRFRTFILISAITMLPGTLIYSYMASELATEGVSFLFFAKLMVAGALLFVLVKMAKRYFSWLKV